ncbi:MAG: VWA domain-containing protein [Bacteroidota bacterium]
MKAFLLIFCFSLSGLVSLKGQIPSSPDTLAWRAIGEHVDFSNAIIYTGWQYHKSVTRLNEDFFWLIREWRAENYEQANLFYLHQEYLTDPIDGYTDLEDYLDGVDRISIDLSTAQSQRLRAYGDLALQILHELDASHRQLETLIDTLSHTSPESQMRVLAALEEQGYIFDRLSTHCERYNQAIQNTYADYQPATMDFGEDQTIAQSFSDIIDPAHEVLEAIKADDSLAVVNLLNELRVSRELFFVQVEDQLGEVQYYEPGILIKPRVRYDFVLKQLDDLIEYAQDYLDAPSQSRLPYSNSYFYFNERLIAQYNRQGLGMAYQGNLFLESTDLFLPKWQDMPNWFDPIDEEIYDLPIELFDEPITEAPIVTVDSLPTNSLEGYASNNLVLLLDVSASMNTAEKLGLLKSSFRYLVNLMRPQDRVAIITYSGDSKLILESTAATMSNKTQILKAIDSLDTEGRTSILNGMNRAFAVASANYISSGNNKIILATDGVFDEEKKLWKVARSISRADIQMSVLFYSRTEKDEARMRLQELARNGNGNYIYVEPETADILMLREAQKIRR